MVNYEFLEKLCRCNGISGDEGCVRNLIISEISPYADKIVTDNLGNLLVHKRGKRRAVNKLMISAHMDEVGLMVTDITSDGYVRFDEVGGIDRRILPGKRVVIGADKTEGVIGIKPIHLCKSDERNIVPPLADMYVDVGANSQTEALENVNYGDSICFISDFEQNFETIKSKALDDRFGCCVLTEMIKSDLEYDTDFVFAVQEEVGLRGAAAAAYTVAPEFAIVAETTTAADIPEIDSTKQVCRLGSGAVISVMDRRTIYDKQLVNKAFEVAERCGIKAQYKRAVAGGNDAGVIHRSRGGIRTLAVSLPCRYLHSPSTVACKDDCESTLLLVKNLAQAISGGEVIGNAVKWNDNFGK